VDVMTNVNKYKAGNVQLVLGCLLKVELTALPIAHTV
jgi:hypothetical protein